MCLPGDLSNNPAEAVICSVLMPLFDPQTNVARAPMLPVCLEFRASQTCCVDEPSFLLRRERHFKPLRFFVGRFLFVRQDTPIDPEDSCNEPRTS
jgi:hypothetical protein